VPPPVDQRHTPESPLRSGRGPTTYRLPPNAERRTPNAERRTPNAERRTPNAERRTPNECVAHTHACVNRSIGFICKSPQKCAAPWRSRTRPSGPEAGTKIASSPRTRSALRRGYSPNRSDQARNQAAQNAHADANCNAPLRRPDRMTVRASSGSALASSECAGEPTTGPRARVEGVRRRADDGASRREHEREVALRNPSGQGAASEAPRGSRM